MTRSQRVRWLIEELGLTAQTQIETVNVFVGAGRTPEYKQIHPHGFVPALEIDGVTMIESGAICLYLADRHADKGLAPRIEDPLRALYCQWMVYVPASCDPHLEAIMFHSRFLPEPKRLPALVETSKKRWATAEKVIAEGLGDNAFMLGDKFSAADIMVTTAFLWSRGAEAFGGDPKLTGYLERTMQRPAFQRASAGDS